MGAVAEHRQRGRSTVRCRRTKNLRLMDDDSEAIISAGKPGRERRETLLLLYAGTALALTRQSIDSFGSCTNLARHHCVPLEIEDRSTFNGREKERERERERNTRQDTGVLYVSPHLREEKEVFLK